MHRSTQPKCKRFVIGKPRAKKEGRSTHYNAAQKGTATGDGSGVLPVGPTTSKGVLPVGQPLKAIACVQVLTKPRLSSLSTMWNFVGNFAL